ncbi:hypothetical protein [Bacteroides faecichinchillae]|nr:hypothetical protein [Bacteroides faecichinchillae]
MKKHLGKAMVKKMTFLIDAYKVDTDTCYATIPIFTTKGVSHSHKKKTN